MAVQKSAYSDEIELLYLAVAQPIGIVVAVSDYSQAVTRLYQARRKVGDPDLNALQLRRSAYRPDDELWIIKGGATVPIPAETPANGS